MKKETTRALLYLLVIFMLPFSSLSAQCRMTNHAFASGEEIQYDLYFNFGIVNARAGSGSLVVTDANYRGENAYKTVMMLNTRDSRSTVYRAGHIDFLCG